MITSERALSKEAWLQQSGESEVIFGEGVAEGEEAEG